MGEAIVVAVEALADGAVIGVALEEEVVGEEAQEVRLYHPYSNRCGSAPWSTATNPILTTPQADLVIEVIEVDEALVAELHEEETEEEEEEAIAAEAVGEEENLG